MKLVYNDGDATPVPPDAKLTNGYMGTYVTVVRIASGPWEEGEDYDDGQVTVRESWGAEDTVPVGKLRPSVCIKLEPGDEGYVFIDRPHVRLTPTMKTAVAIIHHNEVTYTYRPMPRSTRKPLPVTAADLTPVYSHGLNPRTVQALIDKGIVTLSALTPHNGRVLVLA